MHVMWVIFVDISRGRHEGPLAARCS